MSQHTGIAESRRRMIHEHLMNRICDPNVANLFNFECICIQRIIQTQDGYQFYYLIQVNEKKSDNLEQFSEHSEELWLTIDECFLNPRVLDAVNLFVTNEREQIALQQQKLVGLQPPTVQTNLIEFN